MIKNKKRKGYALLIVMILCFVMSMTVVSASPLIFRYMSEAKENLGDLEKNGLYRSVWEVQRYESV